MDWMNAIETIAPLAELKDLGEVEELEEIIEKPYTLRKVKADDLFLMISILRKLNIKEFASCLQTPQAVQLIKSFSHKKEEGESGEEIVPVGESEDITLIGGISIALELAGKILEQLPKCKDDLFNLLANVSGMSVKEIENLDIDIFFEMLVDFIMAPEFGNFIKVASKFSSKAN